MLGGDAGGGGVMACGGPGVDGGGLMLLVWGVADVSCTGGRGQDIMRGGGVPREGSVTTYIRRQC